MKRAIKGLLKLLLAIAIMWMVITITICRFKHPELSETELFFSIPKAFILNF